MVLEEFTPLAGNVTSEEGHTEREALWSIFKGMDFVVKPPDLSPGPATY